jgi:hypothetical protein
MTTIAGRVVEQVRQEREGLLTGLIVCAAVTVISYVRPRDFVMNGFPVLLPYTLFGVLFVLWPLFKWRRRQGWPILKRYAFLVWLGPLVAAFLPPLFIAWQLMLMGAACGLAVTALWIAVNWLIFGNQIAGRSGA